MERNIENQNQSANFRKFLVGHFPAFNDLTPLLGQPINNFLSADELIAKLIEVRQNMAFSNFFINHFPEFKIYLVEIIKNASIESLENLMACRIGQRVFPDEPRVDCHNLKNKILSGQFDDSFIKTLVMQLGGDFFDKNLTARCEQLNNLREALFIQFERNIHKARVFIAAVIPLPQDRPVSEDEKNALYILSQHRFVLFMTLQQKTLANEIRNERQPAVRQPQGNPNGRSLQQFMADVRDLRQRLRGPDDHLRHMFHRPAENNPAVNPRIVVPPQKFDLLKPSTQTVLFEERVDNLEPFLSKLKMPNCFNDTLSLGMIREPVILISGQSYHKASIKNHFINCYNTKKNPNCPNTRIEIRNTVTNPDEIPLVSNKLLKDIITMVLTLVESPQFEDKEFTQEKLGNLIEAFIRSATTKEMLEKPVVMLEGKNAGETFERSEIINKLKVENPGLTDEAIEKKFVPNYAIIELIDFVKEHAPKEDLGLKA